MDQPIVNRDASLCIASELDKLENHLAILREQVDTDTGTVVNIQLAAKIALGMDRSMEEIRNKLVRFM